MFYVMCMIKSLVLMILCLCAMNLRAPCDGIRGFLFLEVVCVRSVKIN